MKKLLLFVILTLWPVLGQAQELTVGTVTRLPFSMDDNGRATGFSIELWHAVAEHIGAEYTIRRFDKFGDMLAATQAGAVDASIANISITAGREQVMDFTQPIFSAGLQIMTHVSTGSGGSIWSIVTSPDLLLAVVLAFGLLFGGGMLMWRFERNAQPYFDAPAKKAMFPAFWWALNLVVNGGFEERMPRTSMGRIFGVVLVISSLFLVSLFVAKITSMMTVQAITSSINSVNDLYGKRIATVSGSTAAIFLDNRDLSYAGFDNPQEMLTAFEQGGIDAVVFDAPILAYYTQNEGRKIATMAGPVFLRENYGIALPSNSLLAEDINQALLNLREDGTYAQIRREWFGTGSD